MKFCSVHKVMAAIVFVSLGLILTEMSPAFARSRNYSNYRPKPPKPREWDKIVKVDTTANTVTIHDHVEGKDVVYAVNKFTKVTIDDQASDLTKLQPDMNVEIAVSGGKTLTKIDANTRVTKSAKKK